MDTIRTKIKELAVSYKEQLKIYKQIQGMGLQEKDLIADGRFSGLLEVLREKGELMKKAADYDARIIAGQNSLTRHFELDTFSLPRLKTAAGPYQNELATLEAVIADLVPVLEALEEQERHNEALLSDFLERTKDPGVQRWREMRAGRAYGRKNRS